VNIAANLTSQRKLLHKHRTRSNDPIGQSS